MAKHRELARELYASSLGRKSASTIWRTVVFAGAMLAAPLTGCGGSPKKPATVTPDQSAGAPDQAAKDKEAADKAAADKAAADQAAAAAEAEKAAADTQAKADADAKAQADADAKAQADADAKRAEEEAAAKKKRPRGGDARPKGRGFVLA